MKNLLCGWGVWMMILLGNVALAQNARPNIIFILTDDQSVGYMGCDGNDIVQTPNLDQLAAEGLYFKQAYITSGICTPSRVSMLLSQYERKHGVNFNSGTSVSEEAWEDAYPLVLRRNGYYTGWVGKNHAPVGQGGYTSGVMEQSFDYWYAGHRHLSFYPKKRHEIFKHAQANTQPEVLLEGALDFLSPNEQKLEGAIHFLEARPEDKPFCLSINFNLPHDAGSGTMRSLKDDDELYRTGYADAEIPLPPNYVAKADIVTPKLPTDLLKVQHRQVGYDYVDDPTSYRKRYTRHLQAMTGIDRLVGRLRARLEELDLTDNTLIIFTSDHGLFGGQFGLGGKGLCYQQVTHVPLIIFDPSTADELPSHTTDARVQSIDLAATLLTKAGIELPQTYQGQDLSPILAGGDESDGREYIFTENLWSNHFGNPRCEAIQDGRWKYIRYYFNGTLGIHDKQAFAEDVGYGKVSPYGHDNPTTMITYRQFAEGPLQGEPTVYEELYDLQNDPAEAENLIDAKKHRKHLQRLRDAWEQHLRQARGTEPPKVLALPNK
ncbi:sulfatase-like hydrolase/transferase [Pontibacter sp. G13]|uniref:sulfatase-like hydrolase/transferase n=1 Tax=Pontibacter sp. G13 TaxID=3074898 RepID=UPI00288BF0D3|nr:sulfatase-like hydrolase/transferase [Pontibacter sp. G13]WNJ16996.1 sulfatase-like hydrolase/transferase [Pontibacter sp. G13]